MCISRVQLYVGGGLHLNKSTGMVVVSESALPEVIIKVLHAKELKAASQQMSSSEACRIVGISRSAYYKYKDSVFRYEEQSEENIFSLELRLIDRQGVLSSVISALYELGMNIIKINQNPPVDAVASVSLSVRRDPEGACSRDNLTQSLEKLDGVAAVKVL
ncbi:MAG: ACT domain-containing protein [Ruminococcus sp.]|nr:ACT domain-containing protein [Ruminococcus sp.]